MELLHPTTFASAVASSKDSLKNISRIISKYCGNNDSEEFLNACNSLNFTTANKILDKTVEKLTGYSYVSIALNDFAEKFPTLPELSDKVSSAISEAEKVKAIDKYQKEILSIIDGSF